MMVEDPVEEAVELSVDRKACHLTSGSPVVQKALIDADIQNAAFYPGNGIKFFDSKSRTNTICSAQLRLCVET